LIITPNGRRFGFHGQKWPRLLIRRDCDMMVGLMSNPKQAARLEGPELISLAQKLARDAERHALLSASLASQADRLMLAGLKMLDAPKAAKNSRIVPNS
jgi:hypothetical protein